MTLSLSLPPELDTKLRNRAAAAGQDVAAYVVQLLNHFGQAPTPLLELSGPIYQ